MPPPQSAPQPYMPHVDLLLQALRVSRERLMSKSKVAIDTELLRALLQGLCAGLPFSEPFYTKTYPDIAEGKAEGRIPDLRRHMVEQGYLEGRMGAPPALDERYYLSLYPDVKQAIEQGDVGSALEHYIKAGAAEGRIPNPSLEQEVGNWNRILRG